MKIYLAGPLFTAAELQFNKELKLLLEKIGHKVWLPQEKEPRTKTAKAIFLEDVKGIDWADIVVANMDGADPDSGTCWECGYAYRRKPVVVFRTDFRVDKNIKLGPYNLMMWASATECLDGPYKSAKALAIKLKPVLRKIQTALA